MATFLVERRPGPAWVTGRDTREQPLWDEHAAFMDDLFERGLVVLGGPLLDAGGEAVVVLEAESEEAVRTLLAADPWLEAGILGVGAVRAWRLFLDARTRAP